MRRFYFLLILGLILTVNSCNELNETEVENLQSFSELEIDNLNEFYNYFEGSLKSMKLEEFTALNDNIQAYAYEQFDSKKKKELWVEKLEQSYEILDLKSNQKNFLKSIRNKISDLNFENALEVEQFIQEVERNIKKNEFDFEVTKNLFTTLEPLRSSTGSLESNLKLKREPVFIGESLAISHLERTSAINLQSNSSESDDTEDCEFYGTCPSGNGSNCSTHSSCQWCTAYPESENCICPTDCEPKNSGCGWFLLQRCEAYCDCSFR